MARPSGSEKKLIEPFKTETERQIRHKDSPPCRKSVDASSGNHAVALEDGGQDVVILVAG
jgi:hypothetical protein